jgi:hypothetical protein
MFGLCMQWWVSKVGINYELVYILTILPAISLIPCKITVLAVVGFMFFFLYRKLSLFTEIICLMHILFHLHFHNSFKHSQFILLNALRICLLLFNLQQPLLLLALPHALILFLTIRFTSAQHSHMLPVVVSGNWLCTLNPSTQRFLFMYYVCPFV